MQSKLEQLKKNARRITKEEQKLSALRMYERSGLDLDDVTTMANAVGLEVDDLLLMYPATAGIQKPRRIKGLPGRRATTAELGFFAAERRERGLTWQEILVEWRTLFPKDMRVKHKDIIREAYRRHYGDKAENNFRIRE
ncbi:MAG: hypothetical protein ACYTGL_28425 [Planctomycetota bacterium]|jgi:hypothetical protein